MTNLYDTAKSLLTDCLGDVVNFDLDALREEVNERAHEAADNACIYYHDCAEIISRYESDPRADTDNADDGETYKASDYRQAMTAYAYYIAHSIIEAEASDLIDELEEANEHLTSVLTGLGLDVETSAIRLSQDCPHGWAAHDREDDKGACYWVSGQLDGCNAVAVPAAGVWLSYTWNPEG